MTLSNRRPSSCLRQGQGSVSGHNPKSVHGVSRAYQYGVCAEPTFHLTRNIIGRGVTRTPEYGARSVRFSIFSIAGNSSSRARADAELPPVLGVGSHLFLETPRSAPTDDVGLGGWHRDSGGITGHCRAARAGRAVPNAWLGLPASFQCGGRLGFPFSPSSTPHRRVEGHPRLGSPRHLLNNECSQGANGFPTSFLPAHLSAPSVCSVASFANERSDGERVWTTQKEGNRSP